MKTLQPGLNPLFKEDDMKTSFEFESTFARHLRTGTSMSGLIAALVAPSVAAAADRFVEVGGTNTSVCTSN